MLRRLLKKTLKVLIGFVFLWGVGLILFWRQVPHAVTDAHTHVEAIVVLTGGRDRLKTGFALLCQGFGDLIFISGVHPNESLKKILKPFEAAGCPQSPEWLAARTHIGHTATNTMENAVETAEWLKQRHITSIRLVTAAYHIPRSLVEFRRFLPELKVIAHPVFPPPFNQSNWWGNYRTLSLLLSEYHKFLYAFLRMQWLRG